VLEQRRALACVVARRSMFGGSPRRIVLADAGRAPRRAADDYVVGSPLKAGG
jgi:hypothetical protein